MRRHVELVGPDASWEGVPVITTVHLVRHGEVENPAGIIYGRLPGYHLSGRGRLEAEAAARHLAGADVALVWSSPLERAQETAAAIAERHDIEVVGDQRLVESHTSFEGIGRSFGDLGRSSGALWRARNPTTPSWGESFRAIRARMLEVAREAVAAAAGRSAVLVSHQTPVRVARLALSRRKVPPWLDRTPCATGSVSTIVLDGERFVSSSYFAPPGATDAETR